MSDWGMYEIEDIVWDEFSESHDHIVPHPGGEQVVDCAAQGDCDKKPRHKIVSSFTKNENSKYAVNDSIHGKEETSFPTLKDKKAPMLEKGSWSCTPADVFPASCDTDSIKEVTSLTADDTKTPGNCFNSSNVDSIGSEYCVDDPILGNRGAGIDGNLCRFPLGDISSAGSDLEFFTNEHEDKESNDLLYYGWPDIGNFEDVDRMFRSCDSTFGQGNSGNDDELSWFSSSSHAINGSEDALKLGFKSSSSESNELKSTSKHHEPDMEFMVDTLTPLMNDSDEKNVPNTYKTGSRALDGDETATLGHSSYASWSGTSAENKGEATSNEQGNEVNRGIEVKISPVTQTKDGSSVMMNLQTKQGKHLNQWERKRKDRSLEYLGGGPFHAPGTLEQTANVKLPSSMSSARQNFPSSDVLRRKKILRPDFSSYLHTYNPCVHPEYNHSSHQIPVTPTTSSIKLENKGHPSVSSKASSYASNHAQPTERSPDSSLKVEAMVLGGRVGKPHRHRQVNTTLTDGPQHEDLGVQAAFTNQVPAQYPYQIQDEIGAHSEVEGKSYELPAVEVDSSTEQHSCMSSALSDEISLKETSFRQLQYVMEQLDIRTKLCIRDSLYRLARSAEQRHNFKNSNSCGRDGIDKNGLLETEESNKCVGFMDMETGTNPIDRSIAHLLFHRPSDASTRAAIDMLSQESHPMIHGSITSQSVMAEKVACQEGIADCVDTELGITDL